MKKHPLEKVYGLSAFEILEAISTRFRLKVAVEGAISEFHMDKQVRQLIGSGVERYENHDLDGKPDFSIWLPGRSVPVLAECKNVRDSSKPGGEGYRSQGEIVAYKVETQKTRAATSDPTSRYYDVDHFQILGVCLGKKTANWSDFLYARSIDLARHAKYPHKLAVFQRVPLVDAPDKMPWYSELSELLSHYGDPPWQP